MQLAAEVQQVRATQRAFPLAIANERVGEEDLSVWVTKESSWFGVLEQLESDVFFGGNPVPYAESGFDFEFLVIVGGDEGNHRVRHVMRLGLPSAHPDYDAPISFLLHDLLESGQGLEYEALEAEYQARGATLSNIPSVESSIRTDSIKRGSSAARLAYAVSVRRATESGWDGLHAHSNQATIKSMGRLGVQTMPLTNQFSVKTPSLGRTGFDDAYSPIFMANDDAVREMMRPVASYFGRQLRI